MPPHKKEKKKRLRSNSSSVVIFPHQQVTAPIRNFPTAQSRHTTAYSCKQLQAISFLHTF